MVHHCPTRRVYKKDTCLRIDLCTGTKRTLIDTNETSHPPYRGNFGLADEPFRCDGISDNVTARVHEVLALSDRCCEEMLDLEYRTACRRVLARVVSKEPEVFRRTGRAETAAAALVWIVGKANDLFEQRTGGMHVRDLMSHFGLRQSSVAQRAATMLRGGIQ